MSTISRMRFLVARNPDPDSSLRFLLRLPIGPGFVLKASDSWRRTNRVYSHRAEGWPDGLEIVEDVVCWSIGGAAQRSVCCSTPAREQVAVRVRASAHRPRGHLLADAQGRFDRAAGCAHSGRGISELGADLLVLIDTREQYPYRFARQKAATERATLAAGDYAVRGWSGEVVAAVERKSVSDLAASLSNGSLAFELAKLGALGRAAVVVEEGYGKLIGHASKFAPRASCPICSLASRSATRRSRSSGLE